MHLLEYIMIVKHSIRGLVSKLSADSPSIQAALADSRILDTIFLTQSSEN